MFTLAIIIGSYAYAIFFLGIFGALYSICIAAVTLIFTSISFFIFRQSLRFNFKLDHWKIGSFLILFLLLIQVLVNIIGVLGPELSFDALWYHLTLPKLYIQNHAIIHFPGWLLNYSTMPKLTEMLYIPALFFGNEITAKTIHFIFGILSMITLYQLSRKFMKRDYALLTILVFYSNLVVGWMSITAYIDLSRTFFELVALSVFYLFIEKKQSKYLYLSAVFEGLALGTKLITLSSFLIYFFLILYLLPKRSKTDIRHIIISLIRFFGIIMLIASPWFSFAYMKTGNPVYPLFSGYTPPFDIWSLLNPIMMIKTSIMILIRSDDPLSPIYLIMIPLIAFLRKRFNNKEQIILWYSILGFIAWYLTPHTGGGRFILPYLPLFSLLIVLAISKLENRIFQKYCISLIVVISFISIGYRFIANKKYIPVITGAISKSEFLGKNLNFGFGDFYDIDGYFAKTIKPTDKVLIYGIHNLYYVDFPFIHESNRIRNDRFNYVLIKDVALPKEFKDWKLKYVNIMTKVKLYSAKQ